MVCVTQEEEAWVETRVEDQRPRYHQLQRRGAEPDGEAHGSSRSNRMPTAEVLTRGLLAGAVGVAAMTAAEKLEQAVTKRPNSYVPAHTLERLLGLPTRPDSERLWLNWTMHWGQGIALGAVRAAMAERGIRGPVGSFLLLNLRLLNDQTLENAT